MEPNTPAAAAAPAAPTPAAAPAAPPALDPSGLGGADVAIAALERARGAAPADPAVAVAPEAPVAQAVQQSAEPAAPPTDDLATRIERAMAARAETTERLRRLDALEREREADRQARESAEAEAARLRQMARENLPELLRAEGWTPEAIVQAMSDIHNPRPEVVRGNQLEQRLARLEADNQALRGEIAAREHAEKVVRFKGSIVPALKAKTEAYSHSLEFFDPEPLQELVFAEIEREYQGSGQVLSIEQAADRIESQLRARVSRVKGLGKAAEPTVSVPSTPLTPPAKPAPKTLTNDLNGSTAHAPEFDPLQDEARLMQAAETLRKGWSAS